MIKSVTWSEDAERGLVKSAGDDLDIIKHQVINKQAQLWECRNDKNHAYIVTRVEETGTGNELVLVLGEGSGFMDFAPAFVEAAKNKGMTIRTHVKRPGMIRLWSRLGLTINEYVLRA